MQSKKELRKFAKDLRENLNIKDVSVKILQIFLSSQLYKDAKNIAAYYPCQSELDIRGLFSDNSKNWFLPKITEDNSLTFHPYKLGDMIEFNKYSILEPVSQKVSPEIFDLIIVPALLCDKCGFRIGYGKGYYDRFFAQNSINAIKIVFIPQDLVVENIENEPFDVRMDYLLTEAGCQLLANV